MTDYIKTPAPKKTKGAPKMSEKKALELPAEPGPKTINFNIRVKTLVIVIALLLSHGLVFWAGLKAPSVYDSYVDGLVKARTAPAEKPAQLKTNQ